MNSDRTRQTAAGDGQKKHYGVNRKEVARGCDIQQRRSV